MHFRYLLLTALFSYSVISHGDPLIDAHSHLDSDYLEELTTNEIIERLNRNHIDRILITSRNNNETLKLAERIHHRVIPFASIYTDGADKADWFNSTEALEKLKRDLKTGQYQGIGELHLFAQNKNSTLFEETIQLASEYSLPILMHGDKAVIERIFTVDPTATVIWAHLGTDPQVLLLQPMLDRYPSLYIDTSVRDERIMGNLNRQGPLSKQLLPVWREFLIHNQDRILIGMDAFSANRWKNYDQVVDGVRQWLDQLPPEVSKKLAYLNASRLFPINSQQKALH